ncbi:hypothetical protein [Rhodococcoides fascians]|uniref:hypothetical protein n=1 Tax=Rhodococcoides fascians TaxID=1828 RepID=UPI00050BE959|nr:hypothetical protein [Rhodococcus fascians]
MTAPCTTNPNSWLQPGEDPNWDRLPATRWAQAQCRNACPAAAFLDCARDALAAGTGTGQTRTRVASGVIAAGEICRGDIDTYYRLNQIVNPGIEPEPYIADDGACTDCERIFVPDDEPIVLGTNTAHRAPTRANVLCHGCYTKARRGGTLNPSVRTIVPDECITCHEPMTRRSNPIDGHVIHEAAGNCTRCVRKLARAAKLAEKVAA